MSVTAPEPPTVIQSTWFARNFRAYRQELAAISAGATAGSLSALVCSPIDVIRTRLQVQATLTGASSQQYNHIASAFRAVWKEEGYRGYFRGYSTAAVIIPVFWGIYFPTYNAMKDAIGESPSGSPMTNALRHGFAALGAAIVTDCATNPLWVVRTRMQTQALHIAANSGGGANAHQLIYTGTTQALRHIARTEGVMSLYKGLTASLFGAVHAVIQFPLYEFLKLKAAEILDVHPTQLTAVPLVASSVISKLVASSIAYPHEVVRARLQDCRAIERPGAIQTFRNIIAKEGAAALYTGFSMNLIRTVPACAITFVTYEFVYAAVMGHKHPHTPGTRIEVPVEDADGVGGDFGSTGS